MIKKKSIAYGLTLLVALISITFLILFNVLMNIYIENRAHDSLKLNEYTYELNAEILYSNDLSEDLYFDTYYIPCDDEEIPTMISSEIELYRYYKKNKEVFEYNEIYVLKDKNQKTYFMPIKDADMEYDEYEYYEYYDEYDVNDEDTVNLEPLEKEDILLYVNVSPVVNIVETVNKVLIGVFLGVILLVMLIGNKTAKYLEESDKKLKNFFSNASHELKTPIMAIQGYAEGIEIGLVDSKESAKIILKESERMSDLVVDILELSKLDSGVIKPNIQYNDIREILYDIIEANEFIATNNKIKIIFELNETLMADCDENMIHSVLSNIVSNNIRYAESFVKITALKSSENIIIKISDDGEKIDEDGMKHVFDRFYKGQKGQTGIGLSLAKEYVELHKGKLYLTSNEKETCFIIQIPIIVKNKIQ